MKHLETSFFHEYYLQFMEKARHSLSHLNRDLISRSAVLTARIEQILFVVSRLTTSQNLWFYLGNFVDREWNVPCDAARSLLISCG